ncbi:MAG: LCP family protein [Parcubacteria group bacterium]
MSSKPEGQFQIYTYKPRNQKRWYKKWYIYVGGLLFLAILYSVVSFGLAYNTIVVDNTAPKDRQSWWGNLTGLFGLNSGETIAFVDPNPIPEEEPNRIDILIMGMRGDDGEESAGQWLTDTMIVLSYDEITKEVAMISIPRDFYIDMPVPEYDDDYRVRGKINEVYVKGLSKDGGIVLAKQVVSKFSGIYIDYGIVFDFEAFQDIVDTLGGIDIYLNKPFSESKQWGYPFELPEGENHLDGQNTLYYVRSRYGSNDFDRARRQQQVIQAIKDKASSLGFLTNPVKVLSLLDDLKGNVRTDLQIWEVKDLLAIAESVGNTPDIEHYVLTTQNLLRESHGFSGEYILLPLEDNYDAIQELFRTILE